MPPQNWGTRWIFRDTGEGGDPTPLILRSKDAADPSLRPKLMFQGATTANPDTLTLVPTEDTFINCAGSTTNTYTLDTLQPLGLNLLWVLNQVGIGVYTQALVVKHLAV